MFQKYSYLFFDDFFKKKYMKHFGYIAINAQIIFDFVIQSWSKTILVNVDFEISVHLNATHTEAQPGFC